LPPETEEDVWSLTRKRASRPRHRATAQSSLHEAITAMERSELVAETLGEHVFDFFLRNKRREWEDYRRQVTAFELERLYLNRL
jgi:glutamine synthetase